MTSELAMVGKALNREKMVKAVVVTAVVWGFKSFTSRECSAKNLAFQDKHALGASMVKRMKGKSSFVTDRVVFLATGCTLGALIPTMAFAYVGPGAGLTAIGTGLALLAALFLAIVGFIWYPLRRLFRKWRSDMPATEKTSPEVDSVTNKE